MTSLLPESNLLIEHLRRPAAGAEKATLVTFKKRHRAMANNLIVLYERTKWT